jgi:aryl-alcohol dehydrogenase-like predicted oxidoreductase
MEYRALGRTRLSVSVMGLGCGGHSRLGLAQNRGEENAINLVQHALASGVNFIDTAEAYGTEEVVGKALQAKTIDRQSVILSTKVSPRRGSEGMRTAAELTEAVEQGLRRLQTDYVDVLHLHGVASPHYEYCVSEFVPALKALQAAGKIRFLGITEAFARDTGHAMLQQAVQDEYWDVMMVGFSLLNQCARERVLSRTQTKNIGILDMFAVRRALSNPDSLRALMAELVQKGQVQTEDFTTDAPLDFLLANGVAESIPDAAYRFCRDEPGIHVVLSGTGNVAHLEENLRSLSRPPLPFAIGERLRRLFAAVDNVSGN